MPCMQLSGFPCLSTVTKTEIMHLSIISHELTALGQYFVQKTLKHEVREHVLKFRSKFKVEWKVKSEVDVPVGECTHFDGQEKFI